MKDPLGVLANRPATFGVYLDGRNRVRGIQGPTTKPAPSWRLVPMTWDEYQTYVEVQARKPRLGKPSVLDRGEDTRELVRGVYWAALTALQLPELKAFTLVDRIETVAKLIVIGVKGRPPHLRGKLDLAKVREWNLDARVLEPTRAAVAVAFETPATAPAVRARSIVSAMLEAEGIVLSDDRIRELVHVPSSPERKRPRK